MFIYEIRSNGELFGDSGDEVFAAIEEAKEDAEDFAKDLADEFEVPINDFDIIYFESDNKVGPFITYMPIGEIK